MKRLLILLVALFSATLPAAADTKFIYAGTLIAIPGEEPLKEQTVVVKQGRILRIAQGYERPPAGVTVIDLRNHFVLPGLIDSHVHMLSELGPGSKLRLVEEDESMAALRGAQYSLRTLRAGFTTVRDLGQRSPAIFALRRAIDEGIVAGPRLVVAGSTLSPTGGHAQTYGYRDEINHFFSSTGKCDGADDCRRAVRQQISRGADVIKLVATGGVLSDIKAGTDQQFTDDELKSIVETAHKLGRKVAAHAHGTDGLNAALRAGADSIEHGSYLDATSIALFRRSGAWYVPTVIAGVTAANYARMGNFLSEAQKAKALKVGPQIQDALRRAHEGGVKIAFGTDSGVSPHGLNAREFSLMVGAGMTPTEALRSATVSAAELLGLQASIGTLEPGKFADIVAVAEDPRRNVKTLEAMQFVMRSGQVYVQK
jgi:imidazolonepropionase-like amidohydrolase